MNAGRPATPGKTRTCPHCKATILETHSICPGCHHHLRFDSQAARRQLEARSALRVEGTIRHTEPGEACEYCIVLCVRNERGEEIARQVVSVGALAPAEQRNFSLSVDLLPAETQRTAPPPVQRPSAPVAPRRPKIWSPNKL